MEIVRARVSRRATLVSLALLLIFSAAVLSVELRTLSPSDGGRRIQVERVALDDVDAPAGATYYVILLDVTNSGTEAWRFDPGFLRLSSNGSETYAVDANYSVVPPLVAATVLPGGSLAGSVTFELPNGQGPTSLGYRDPVLSVGPEVGKVPAVTAIASVLNQVVQLTINGGNVSGWAVGTVNGTGHWVTSVVSTGLVLNSSQVFFTDDRVQVSLWFEYLKKPSDPNVIILQALSNDQGFRILSVEPAPPVVMKGWGYEVGFDVVLQVPPGHHSATLDIEVQFSG